MEERRPGALNSHLLAHVRIGDEIEVWWPYDRQYYPGVVSTLLPSGRHRIDYTDGEVEDLQLSTEQWRFRGAAAARVTRALVAPRGPKPSLSGGPTPSDSSPLVPRRLVKTEPTPVSTSGTSNANTAATHTPPTADAVRRARSGTSADRDGDSIHRSRPSSSDVRKQPPKKTIAKKRRPPSPRRRSGPSRNADNDGSGTGSRQKSLSPAGSRGTGRRTSAPASSTSNRTSVGEGVAKKNAHADAVERRAVGYTSETLTTGAPSAPPRKVVAAEKAEAANAQTMRGGSDKIRPSSTERDTDKMDTDGPTGTQSAGRKPIAVISSATASVKAVSGSKAIKAADELSKAVAISPSPVGHDRKEQAQVDSHNASKDTEGVKLAGQMDVDGPATRQVAASAKAHSQEMSAKVTGRAQEKRPSQGADSSKNQVLPAQHVVTNAVKALPRPSGARDRSKEAIPKSHEIASIGQDKDIASSTGAVKNASPSKQGATESALDVSNPSRAKSLPATPRKDSSEGNVNASVVKKTNERDNRSSPTAALKAHGEGENLASSARPNGLRTEHPSSNLDSRGKDLKCIEKPPSEELGQPSLATTVRPELRSVLADKVPKKPVTMIARENVNEKFSTGDSSDQIQAVSGKPGISSVRNDNANEGRTSTAPVIFGTSKRNHNATDKESLSAVGVTGGDKKEKTAKSASGQTSFAKATPSPTPIIASGIQKSKGNERPSPQGILAPDAQKASGPSQTGRVGGPANGKRVLSEPLKEVKRPRVQDDNGISRAAKAISRPERAEQGKILTSGRSSSSTTEAGRGKLIQKEGQSGARKAEISPPGNHKGQLLGSGTRFDFTRGQSANRSKTLVTNQPDEDFGDEPTGKEQTVKRPRSTDLKDKPKTSDDEDIMDVDVPHPSDLPAGVDRTADPSSGGKAEILNLSDRQAAKLRAAVRIASPGNGLGHKEDRPEDPIKSAAVGTGGMIGKTLPSQHRMSNDSKVQKPKELDSVKNASLKKVHARSQARPFNEPSSTRKQQESTPNERPEGSRRNSAASPSQKANPPCQKQPGKSPDAFNGSGNGQQAIAQKASQANGSRPRGAGRVSQNPEKGTASLPLDILMRTITESNIRSLQARLNPLSTRIETHFAKSDERITKLQTDLTNYANQNMRLSDGQEVLRKAVEQSVSKQSLISAVSALTSKIMSTVRSEMNQVSQKLREDMKQDFSSLLKENVKMLLAEVEIQNEKAINTAVERAVESVVMGNGSGQTMQISPYLARKSHDVQMTDVSTGPQLRPGSQANIRGSGASKDKEPTGKKFSKDPIQDRPTDGKMIEYEKVAMQARKLIAIAVVEWLLGGGARDLAPSTEREHPVPEIWVKESSMVCMKSLHRKFEAFSTYAEAEEALKKTLGHNSRIETEWLMKEPSTDLVKKARLNYIAWDPRLHDFEWESEKRVLIYIAREVIAAEKAVLSRRQRILQPLRSATQCLKAAITHMGGVVGW